MSFRANRQYWLRDTVKIIIDWYWILLLQVLRKIEREEYDCSHTTYIQTDRHDWTETDWLRRTETETVTVGSSRFIIRCFVRFEKIELKKKKIIIIINRRLSAPPPAAPRRATGGMSRGGGIRQWKSVPAFTDVTSPSKLQWQYFFKRRWDKSGLVYGTGQAELIKSKSNSAALWWYSLCFLVSQLRRGRSVEGENSCFLFEENNEGCTLEGKLLL